MLYDFFVLPTAKWWGAGMVIWLEQGADLHMTQLMPVPLTVSCFSKIQIGFTFLVLAHLGSPGKGSLNDLNFDVTSTGTHSLCTSDVLLLAIVCLM